MKLKAWMVDKSFQLDVPLLVYIKDAAGTATRHDFPNGICELDGQVLKDPVFVGNSGYKYVSGLPTSGNVELFVVAGNKDQQYVNFEAAKAEYAALESAVENNPKQYGYDEGPVGYNKPPTTKPNVSSWFKKNLMYIIPGIAVVAGVAIFWKSIKKLFKK